MSVPIINVTQVKKHFKQVKAVDGIDLQIGKGEYVALLGPNGAGKTTLVEMIEGVQEPDSGNIEIKGMSWQRNAVELHRIIGLSLQETHFIDKISVEETLHLFASFYGLGDQRVEEVLKLVNLPDKRGTRVNKLSGGQRQRLALAIALLNQPEILLLDEPTTGLDPTARRELWDILTRLKETRQTTMILTTHYMEEASYLCERIVIMDKGKILTQGTLNELLSKHKEGEVVTYALEKPLNDFHVANQNVLQWTYEQSTGEGEVIVKDIVNFLPGFLEQVREKNITLKSLECRKMTLDDLFILMTGRHIDE